MNKTTQIGNRIVLSGATLLILASMLFTIVKAYLIGGTEAPSLGILLLAIVVLGGGMVFAGIYALSLLKKYPAPSAKKTEETEMDTNESC